MGNAISGTDKPVEVKQVWYPDFIEKQMKPELFAEKIIAITGCTSGTGLVVAKVSAEKGAKTILMLNRPSERAKSAEQQVRDLIKEGSATIVETIDCDLQSFDSVQKAADTIKAKYEAIDVLCNNAGVMALNDEATTDGYDVQMQTNHLSHWLLTKELFPLLKRAKELRGEARIVNHSSLARNGKPLSRDYFGKNGGNLGGNGNSMIFGGGKWERYHQTKLANSVFTAAFADKLKDAAPGIKAVVCAPGFAATNLQVTTAKTGGMDDSNWIMRMAQSAEDGTMPLLAACFDPTTENGDFWEPAKALGMFGPAGMYGPAVKVQYDKGTSNPENWKLLWEASEEACGKIEID